MRTQIKSTKLLAQALAVPARAIVVIVLAGVAAVAGGMVAVSIPSADGTITGCYEKNNGQLRVVESAAECNPSEQSLTWQQLGAVGPQGPQGPQGPEGPPGPAGAGVPTVAGFVYQDGSKFGDNFTITKLGPGRFKLVLPYSQFTNFPAIAVSGWGIPGVAPTVNVFYNISTSDGFESEIRIFGPDGVTPLDWGFQFVAAQVH